MGSVGDPGGGGMVDSRAGHETKSEADGINKRGKEKAHVGRAVKRHSPPQDGARNATAGRRVCMTCGTVLCGPLVSVVFVGRELGAREGGSQASRVVVRSTWLDAWGTSFGARRGRLGARLFRWGPQ